MLNLIEALRADITEGIQAATVATKLPTVNQLPPVVVKRPDNPEHGQYSSPVALGLAKSLKMSPADIVREIVAHMPKKEYIGKLEELNGFLNVRLNPGWLTIRLDNIITENVTVSESGSGRGQSVNLEFISANPTGPLTLGNCRIAFMVDTLGNILEAVGYNVVREYYINDAGGQVQRLGESVVRRILQAQGESVDFPEELYQGDYILKVGEEIAEWWQENEGKAFDTADLHNQDLIAKVSAQAVRILLADIQRVIIDDLQIHFDVWTSEKELRASGAVEAALEQLRERDETYTKDKAEYLRTTKYGDSEDRVLVKSNGDYAYITPDIAYHRNKYERGFALIFTCVGSDHQGHVPKLKAAMAALGYDTSKLYFLVSQWFHLVRNGVPVTISKRKGNIVTPRDLIAEVGYDAARFFLLQHSLNTAMDFDLDLAKEQSERNPVYYVQYAYVRLQSILRKAKEEGFITEVGDVFDLTNSPLLTHTAELQLMYQLYRFPEVVAQIAQTFAAHELTYYARELAAAIHVFYKQVRVLDSDESLVKSRLQLVLAARLVLGKVLELLKISQPEIM